MPEATSRPPHPGDPIRRALRARHWARRRLVDRGDASPMPAVERSEALDLPGRPSAAPDPRRPHLRFATPSASPVFPVAPITGPADPRWVLAVRTAEALQGDILPPERRAKLVRLGKVMGLSIFDSNLVIAVVQDQARRGRLPEHCPAAGESQLALIPLPTRQPWRDWLANPRLRFATFLTALAAAEAAVVLWLF